MMRDRFVLIARIAAGVGGILGCVGVVTMNPFLILLGLGLFLAGIAFLDRDQRHSP